MLAVALPPLLERLTNWAERNPALGAVAALVVVVALLWLLRKSAKFFMTVALLCVVTIMGSYVFYGPQKTNKLVLEGAERAIEETRELRQGAGEATRDLADGAGGLVDEGVAEGSAGEEGPEQDEPDGSGEGGAAGGGD